MRPRRILTGEESSSILDEAVRQSALAVLTVHEGGEWLTFKSRFLERDNNRRFVVLDHQETHGMTPPSLVCGQYVGLSFRHKSRKVMFATVVEAPGTLCSRRENERVGDSLSLAREYDRTSTPSVLPDAGTFRFAFAGEPLAGRCRRAREPAQGRALSVVTGQAADLSCGGTLIRLNQVEIPEWTDNQTLGVELHLPDGQPPLLVDAYYRGTRHDPGSRLCTAVQFVGLELALEGRSVLQRLARCVQKFHRASLAKDLRSGRTRFRGA